MMTNPEHRAAVAAKEIEILRDMRTRHRHRDRK